MCDRCVLLHRSKIVLVAGGKVEAHSLANKGRRAAAKEMFCVSPLCRAPLEVRVLL